MTDALIVPDWRKVLQYIPPDFRDNGVSSPLQPLYGFIYWGGMRRADMALAARIHDFGFGPARLTGSYYSGISREAWDEVYRRCLLDRKHTIIARTHWRGLRAFGAVAWRRSYKKMQKWEWFTYQHFLDDIDKSYRSGLAGIR